MEQNASSIHNTITPASDFFRAGAELLTEVQQILGTDRVRSLRIKLGDREVRQISVGELSTFATIALVLLAVVVTTLSVELDTDTNQSATQ